MRKFNAENERLKRRYEQYLREAKGQDEKSIDKARAALVKFEESTKYKSFKAFHIDQARQFKNALNRAKSARGQPLSLTTTDATLRLVKGFFHWLAGQQGFKKVLSYADVEYFNNNRNDARAAHAERPVQYPSKQAAYFAFQAMADQTELDRRDKALFAFLMITGARIAAVASLRLKHINLVDGFVYQDGRDVRTKGGKTITTWFFPMHPDYLACFTNWVTYLRNDKMFGPEDALFPKPERRLVNGKFVFDRLSRENYANGAKVNEVFKGAFEQVQMHPYGAHSVRKTLGQEMDERNLPLATQKAWSQNLGHDRLSTTVSSYLPVSTQQQGELLKELGAS
ncbi:tyrosine-type recombinase/integrase [Sulfitobacter mediterraneus]|uniref:Integrase n=1 Tax=Sulfitobacter mediterraneus TaxID=83219 RepID=A0A061SPY7_9RHOB|nr:tyrosine-type recombinase/integrase [Sulfitobacter mediterraneus]KAJ01514.1 integrase [Sulfitobacter mediterraneus]